MSSWNVLPPYTGSRSKGCVNCGAVHESLPMSRPLSVGFGQVSVTRDDEMIWSGDDNSVWVRRFENRAVKDPDHDWRIRFNAPLWDGTYQRQGEKHWVLVEKGLGFA